MSQKDDLITDILDIEINMFLTVPTAQPSSCQSYPDSFRMHRRAQFSTWSEETLKSYRSDLQMAERAGKNLMTEKYARMDSLLPPKKPNPLIKEIVDIQYEWQIKMFNKYPNLMGGARVLSSAEDSVNRTSFETYLKSELETYSDNTIKLLHKDVLDSHEKGINLTEELYSQLVLNMGYSSIEEAEKVQKR
ncbi:MAG: DUF4125 family protein [Spirochaetota bacterium]|nr:DUF4125 family protein [Spirochaetota bacterium]